MSKSKQTTKSSQKTQQQQTSLQNLLESAIQQGYTKYALPEATGLQALGERGVAGMLGGYNPAGYGQIAGATTGLMQNLLKSGGLTPTPEQSALLSGQTQNYMQGLLNQLGQWRKGAMSQAQQSALARGIPLSDIARGMESNVDAQALQSIAQGYNQAKQLELQNRLNLPMQNLQLMSGLQQAYNQPYMNLLTQLGTSRLTGPRDVATGGMQAGTRAGETQAEMTGKTTGKNVTTSSMSPFQMLSAIAAPIAGGLAFGLPGAFLGGLAGSGMAQPLFTFGGK